jgi:hypothetical protein
MKVEDMKNIYVFILELPIKVFPFTNHVFELFFPTNGNWHVI